jgi:hypothetical protein
LRSIFSARSPEFLVRTNLQASNLNHLQNKPGCVVCYLRTIWVT